ncbi:hypothetical protein [Echinicola rosea]|uniref:Uncharacterized protein n=1 Tax=Echinicola rosea TaxID=1807691 RepID=A0ABQ1VA53_9BACT|nr:hypothetical protein [Echinicola rosea]GGF43988.1 hypothetical protein GCM10011339_35600 [Echinicola rosea]
MSTHKLQIADRASKHKGEALTNLHQYIDVELLTSSYRQLNKTSSVGVDEKAGMRMGYAYRTGFRNY